MFNVGTGLAYSVEHIIESLRRMLGRAITAVQDPARLRASERMLLVAEIAKIRRETQWTPRVSLEDTLKDLIAAYRLPAAAARSELPHCEGSPDS